MKVKTGIVVPARAGMRDDNCSVTVYPSSIDHSVWFHLRLDGVGNDVYVTSGEASAAHVTDAAFMKVWRGVEWFERRADEESNT